MTFSPVEAVRPRLVWQMDRFTPHTAGQLRREATGPGSDARLGDGGEPSLMVGHAHGAQTLEAQLRTVLGSLEGALNLLQPALRLHAEGNFMPRDFHRRYLRK